MGGIAGWGPAEWIAVIGAGCASVAWAARVLALLIEVRSAVRELRCWTEVLSEEFPELHARVADKLRLRDSLLGLLRAKRGLDLSP